MITGVFDMTEMILNAKTLPEPLSQMIGTEKVRITEMNGIINLTPILGTQNGCPLRGLATDSSLTVEKFLAMTHDEKEIE